MKLADELRRGVDEVHAIRRFFGCEIDFHDAAELLMVAKAVEMFDAGIVLVQDEVLL